MPGRAGREATLYPPASLGMHLTPLLRSRPPPPGGKLLSTSLYVGNIPYDSTAEDLRDWFSDFGTVTSARVAWDRVTGPRGFGFVEMADGAENAIAALNGFRLNGRPLAVNVDEQPSRGKRRPARRPA